MELLIIVACLVAIIALGPIALERAIKITVVTVAALWPTLRYLPRLSVCAIMATITLAVGLSIPEYFSSSYESKAINETIAGARRLNMEMKISPFPLSASDVSINGTQLDYHDSYGDRVVSAIRRERDKGYNVGLAVDGIVIPILLLLAFPVCRRLLTWPSSASSKFPAVPQAQENPLSEAVGDLSHTPLAAD